MTLFSVFGVVVVVVVVVVGLCLGLARWVASRQRAFCFYGVVVSEIPWYLGCVSTLVRLMDNHKSPSSPPSIAALRDFLLLQNPRDP